MRSSHATVAALALSLLSRPASGDGPSSVEGPPAEERLAIQRLVAGLRDEAARIRGLAWKHDVPADLLTKEQVVAKFREELAEEYTPEEHARDTRVLRRMGLLQAGEDVIELTLLLLREGVLGFYDPKTKRIYITAGMAGEASQPAILHELIHALEDQHVDLQARTRPWEEDPDRLFAEKCISEGSAEVGRLAFEAAHPEIARKFMESQTNPERVRGQIETLSKVPAFMILPVQLQYEFGPLLVKQYAKDDYPGGMTRLYADPPTTQEQCLHPERWVGERRDLPRRVVWGGDLAAAAGDGWRKLHELTQGELDFSLFLDYHLGRMQGRLDLQGVRTSTRVAPVAYRAAAGWDGARDVYLARSDAQPVGWVSAMAFDTVADAGEAAEALSQALEKLAGESWTHATWSMPPPTKEGESRAMEMSTANGRGVMLQRGNEVLVADGFPPEVLDRLWPLLEKTRFDRDPADGW